MKNITKILAAVVAALTALLQVPAIQSVVVAFFTAHPSVSALLGGVTAILALLHQPDAPVK